MNNVLARDIINLLAISVLRHMIKQNDLFGAKERKPLLHMVWAVGVSIVAEIMTLSFMASTTTHRIINLVSCVIGFGISPFIPLLMARAFRLQKAKVNLVFHLPAISNLVLTVLSPFYGFIFRITSTNEYFRGSLFIVYVASYLFGLIFVLIWILQSLSIYQNKNKPVLFGLILLTLIGTTIQVAWPAVLSSWTTVTFVVILGYAYYSELLEQHDAMTSLFNRRAYEQHLPRLASQDYGTIILFDVDDFKQKNDEYGHQYGDTCLKIVATSILTAFAKVGFCYRIGGDEFSVLSECTDEKTIREAETDFLKTMALAREQDPRIPWVSFGHAFYDSSSSQITEVAEEADQKLYLHKRQRKLVHQEETHP